MVWNGKSVCFWEDRWMGDDKLADLDLQRIECVDMDRTVRDYWEEDRGWCWKEFSHKLPASRLLMMAGVTIRTLEGEDSVGWLKQDNKKFSVRSVFSLLRRDVREDT